MKERKKKGHRHICLPRCEIDAPSPSSLMMDDGGDNVMLVRN
ncbi:uncharacterized protein G2W53_029178 [Senna tora]|uniref:Uncharacterized protein n=1 Tax=Senna tora TaxID=362788 RepID=A0A834WFH6_9FABA|nr:uncharacterized protein G2W53_029178 [Senna tora]